MQLLPSPFSGLEIKPVGNGRFNVRGFIFGPDGGSVILRSTNTSHEIKLPGVIGSTCVFTIDNIVDGIVADNWYALSTNTPANSTGSAITGVYFSDKVIARNTCVRLITDNLSVYI